MVAVKSDKSVGEKNKLLFEIFGKKSEKLKMKRRNIGEKFKILKILNNWKFSNH